MYEIAFRCDASKFYKIGTGHLYRCLAIAEGLTKKYKLKKNKIIFICKKNNLFNKIKKIIKNKNFNVVFFNRENEENLLNKLKSKNIIFDRIQTESKKIIKIATKKYQKAIFFDTYNNDINGCLRINGIIHKKKIKYSGYKYLITPLLNEKRDKFKIDEKKIFINLGGINKILSYKIYKNLIKIKKFKDFKFCLPEDSRFSEKNIEFYDSTNFYKKIKESKIIICSGGLVFFDALILDKKILVFAKDRLQRNNILNINRLFNSKIQIINNLKDLKLIFLKLHKSKNKYKKILNIKNMDLTLKIIYNYLYD